MSGEPVRVTIDGQEVTVPAGTLLVEAAARAGIEIPVFCYHPKLDPVGVCRMCLVAIEGMPKLAPACTTPVRDGMVVHTATENVQTVQRGVLEFLLLNHPLDCPVCDKGGECPLQDNTYRYGPAVSRLTDGKLRKRKAVDLGRFIVFDEERCILCRRCVRFDDEVAQERNLIVGQRGYRAVVTTATGGSYDSYFSGNTIELCPVGALTSDLYRFKSRPWDLSSTPSVCTGCSLGCNIRLDFRFGRLLRVMGRDNLAIDGGWLCDRGRFNYDYVNDADGNGRLTQPLVRRDGKLVSATWTEALAEIRQRLGAIRSRGRGDAVGLIGGGRLTNEAAYLFQKLGRAVLGTPHVDHRAGSQLIGSGAAFPGRVTDVDGADAILIVDVLPQERIPVLDLRIRRALERRDARVAALGPALPVYGEKALGVAVAPGETAAALRRLTSIVGQGDATADSGSESGSELAGVAAALRDARKVVVLWGGAGEAVGEALLELLDALAAGERSVHLLVPGEQANSAGADFMGVRPGWLPGYRRTDDAEARALVEKAWRVKLPEGRGWNTGQMLQAAAEGRLEALIVAGANPAVTYPNGPLAETALSKVPFLVVVDLFRTATADHADVVLPAAPFPAVEGTYTNVDGHVQAVDAAMEPGGESRTDVQILQALAEAAGAALIPSAQEFQWELQHLVGSLVQNGRVPTAPRAMVADDPVVAAEGASGGNRTGRGTGPSLRLVPVERLFAGGGTAQHDSGVARARPEAAARIHPDDGAALGLRDGDGVVLSAGGAELTLTVRLAEDVPAGTVQVPAGLPEAPVNRLLGHGAYPTAVLRRHVLEEVG